MEGEVPVSRSLRVLVVARWYPSHDQPGRGSFVADLVAALLALPERALEVVVASFEAMSSQGASGGLAGIAGGIAEALITTALGLLVAIPAVWFYNYFTTKIEYLTAEMTHSSKELIDYLIKSVGSEFGRSIFTKEFQAQKAVSGSGHIS